MELLTVHFPPKLHINLVNTTRLKYTYHIYNSVFHVLTKNKFLLIFCRIFCKEVYRNWTSQNETSHNAFGRKPTARFGIEIQHLQFDSAMTLTLNWSWPWCSYEYHKLVTQKNLVSNSPKSPFTKVTLTLTHDLDTQTWPRYGQDVPSYQTWSFYVKAFKSYSPNGQTDTRTVWKH